MPSTQPTLASVGRPDRAADDRRRRRLRLQIDAVARRRTHSASWPLASHHPNGGCSRGMPPRPRTTRRAGRRDGW